MQEKIVIIGAGPGGLSAAMILAHRGFKVTVVEKADRVGGRNAELKVGNYSFDTGPTFLHQKFTLDEIFAETGRDSSDYMDFVKLDPMTRLTWGSGDSSLTLETTCDEEKMAAAIAETFPGNEEGYRRFMADHAPKLQAIYPVLQKPYHKLTAYLRAELVKVIPYIVTRKSVVDVLDQYFTDDRLKLAFTFQAKYLGMSPWKCPALFSILSYTEYKYGIYHIQGGLCGISKGMAKAATEEGADIRLSTFVNEVLIDPTRKDRATGVLLENGERIHADHVIMNADYAQAITTLMNGHGKSPEELRGKKYSCSAFMLYLGLDKIYEDEPHHHILFAGDYAKNVAQIQGESEVSQDASIYIRNSSVTDPNVAPPGHSQLYILVPTINCRHLEDWETTKAEYRDRILETIENRTGMKDLRQHIVAEKILTPSDWRDNYDIFMGATFNLAHTIDQMLYFRPHNRLKGYENLYLVGGGTHPGSGLPTILESGRISSNLLCEAAGQDYTRADLRPDFMA